MQKLEIVKPENNNHSKVTEFHRRENKVASTVVLCVLQHYNICVPDQYKHAPNPKTLLSFI